MLNVLLVQPIKEKKHILNLMPPLGLGYLASAIRNANNVTILDCVKEGFDLKEFRDYVARNRPDVVAFTVFTCDLENVNQSIDAIKKMSPNIITIAGGPHPSGDPSGTLAHLRSLDYAFAGEAEKGFPLLLAEISKEPAKRDLKNIPGLVWKSNGMTNMNPKTFTENLDEIAFPSWDLIKLRSYRGVPNGVFTRQYPFAPIIVTRGCPYLCTFCSAHNIVGRKLRYRSINNVMEEIRILHEQFGIREIHIEDDNFTFNLDFAKKFCKRLIELNLPLTYSCPNGIRLDRIDRELLSLMKRAGFYNIYVGIESGSSRILRHMKKKLEPDEILKKVNLIKEVGFEVSGYFMLGYPEETLEDIEETINFARDLPLDWAHFAAFIPIPGSEIMENEEIKELCKSINWSDFFNTDVPFSPRGISRNELKQLQRKAFLKFYLRPAKVVNLIRKLRKDNLALIIRRIGAYILQ